MKLNQHQRQAFVLAVMNDTPFESIKESRSAIQNALAAAMSPAVRKIYETAPKALRTEYLSAVLHGGQYGARGDFFVIGDADEATVTKPWRAKVAERRSAEQQLREITSGCKTLAQLKKALPELERYMPSEAATTAYPADIANTVSALVSLGWPKSAVEETPQTDNFAETYERVPDLQEGA